MPARAGKQVIAMPVAAKWQRMPSREQNLLLLRYWIGLSHKEVAQVVNLPEGTVRRQCAAALQRLRRMWEEGEAGHAVG